MFPDLRIILPIVTFFCATVFAEQNIFFSLSSIDDNSVTLDFRLKEPCKDNQMFFAFTSQPNTGFHVNASVYNGTSGNQSGIPVKLSTSGWSGKYWLQWCSFNPCSPQIRDSVGGYVKITFDSPVYRGVNPEDISIKGGCLFVPTSQVLARTAIELPQLPLKNGVRLEITEDGIYEISAESLKSLGVPVDAINSSTYRLFEKKREIPLYITNSQKQKLGPEDRIMFYGQHLSGPSSYYTQYSNTNVYWLTWGTATGARYAEVSGEMRKDPTRYTTSGWIRARDFVDTVHLEADNYILFLGDLSDRPPEEITDPPDADTTIDNWYWGKIGNNELTTYTVDIPAPAATGNARMIINMMGTTKFDSVPNDHFIRILFNDNPLGNKDSAVWDGKRSFTFKSDSFKVSMIKNDKNTISFLVRDRGFRDYAQLNWIELIYPRSYQSRNDSITFKSSINAPGNVIEYEISGFSSDQLELWDIDRGRYFVDFTRKSGSGNDRGRYSLVFQDSINYGTTYLAQSTTHHLKPRLMALDTIKNNWEQLAGTDYLVISTDKFRTEFEPLLKMHKEHGLSTAFVDIGDIYNRFSFGVRDPESIRTFLKYLFSISGKKPPRYLLLGGDTTHDLDKALQDRNIIPTHLSRVPGWGPGSDDGYFSTVYGEDNFPDLCIGRFPAQNTVELRTLIQKTINYSENPQRGYWRDNVLLLGGGDRNEPEFTQFNNEAVSDIIGPKMNTLRIDAYPNSIFYKDEFVASSLIADYINSGVFLINFDGHGGGNTWSDNNFFSFKDLPKLYNGQWGSGGRLPVVFSFTCLTGFFESPDYRSLGEELIRTDKNGAISFYGASAYTSRNGNILMNKLLLETAMDGDFETIGEFIDFCEMSMLVRYGSQYLHLIRQYNLLGDPALPWRLTPDTLKLSLSHTSLKQGDSLVIDGITNPVKNGSIKLMVKSGNDIWNQSIDSVNSSSFSHSFTVKDNAGTSSGLVRAYAWNDSSEVRGWAMFAKDTVMVYDVTLSPEQPFFGDSVRVFCKLAASSECIVQLLYALAPSLGPEVSFSTMPPMIADSSGFRVSSEKIYLKNSDEITDRLLLKFRVYPKVETPKESSVFSFGIRGRPDLAFTDNSLKMQWSKDSLRIAWQVLNMGNAASPPFQTLLQWINQGNLTDTIALINYHDSLAPGKVQSFSMAVPDTQGSLEFSAYLNSNRSFLEILDGNNRIPGQTHLKYADLKNTTDTLTSEAGGLSIVPAKKFTKKRRVFLFDDQITETAPLLTSSRWIALNNDSVLQMSIGCRPSLNSSDSLDWLFRPDTVPLSSNLKKSSATASGKISVMTFDTVLNCWRYAGGDFGTTGNLCKIRNNSSGPLALASLDDVRPPDIEVSVFGRTLAFLDYAAKGKPFSIMLSDPSQIYPPSVHISLNKHEMPESSRSSTPASGDLKNILITAYPDPENAVDSMSIEVQDLAGNNASRTYAYMPGEDLDIKFLSCHPNPFTAHTMADGTVKKARFAFLLTDVADKIDLTIFTVSGKKIRSWKLRSLIGYQELEWDGRDKDGFRIANGTYYVKLTAQNSGKKVKKILRIAKLEGY